MGSLQVTPTQITMGSVRFGIALLVLAGLAIAKDVFRYEDEETGQSHYMTGEPGKAVEGGWKFTNGDGTFYSLYKEAEARIADGFKPEDEYLPDTAEVEEAKIQFYNLYEEAEARVADAIAAAEKEPTMEDGAAKVVEIAKREAEPYWHMPYLLNHKKEDLEGKAFKFEYYKGFVPLEEGEETAGPVFKHVPYRGFVPEKQLELEAEAKAKHEEAVEKYQAEAKARHEESVAMYKKAREEAKAKHEAAVAKYEAEAKARYEKVVAYRKEAMAKHKEAVAKYKEKIENTVYTFSPYYGYIPTTGEESDEVPTFKYVPFHGFVPSEMEEDDSRRRKRDTTTDEEMMMEDDNLMVESSPKVALLSPFGYMMHHTQPKEISYEFHPYYGYIPKLKTSEETAAEGDTAAKGS